jgi:hypothetical protein
MLEPATDREARTNATVARSRTELRKNVAATRRANMEDRGRPASGGLGSAATPRGVLARPNFGLVFAGLVVHG